MPEKPGPNAIVQVGFDLPQGLRYRFSFAEGQGARIEDIDGSGRIAGASSLAEHIAAIPCFTPDCPIETNRGPVPAGLLAAGALVLTRDNGLQPVRWIGSRRFDWRMLGLNPLLRPIQIAAGSLGDGRPGRDLDLSPNHGLAVRGRTGKAADGAGKCLVQARDLLGRSGVSRPTCHQVTYLQVLCDRHELLSAAGIWCESFRPTTTARAALDPDQRAGLDAALQRIGADASDYPAALPSAHFQPEDAEFIR